MWEVPPTIIHLNLPRTGGSSALQTKIWDMTRDIMEEVRFETLSYDIKVMVFDCVNLTSYICFFALKSGLAKCFHQ